MAERKAKTSKIQQFDPKTHGYDRAVIVYCFLIKIIKNLHHLFLHCFAKNVT